MTGQNAEKSVRVVLTHPPATVELQLPILQMSPEAQFLAGVGTEQEPPFSSFFSEKKKQQQRKKRKNVLTRAGIISADIVERCAVNGLA